MARTRHRDHTFPAASAILPCDRRETLALNIRLAGIDTPEIRGKCDAEKQLAKKAQDFTRRFIAEGPVMVTTEGVGKYGRVIAKVESLIRLNDTDLGEALIKAGLAWRWPPKPGETWCPTGSP